MELLHDCRKRMQESYATGQFIYATPRGFEPLRAEPNGFRVHLLNRSDTVSLRHRQQNFDATHISSIHHTVLDASCHRSSRQQHSMDGVTTRLNNYDVKCPDVDHRCGMVSHVFVCVLIFIYCIQYQSVHRWRVLREELGTTYRCIIQ